MTDLAIPNRATAVVPDQATPGIDLEVWARQAKSAAVYAEAVCSTTMAPSAYRGKPAEAAAAILAGAELGFSPMASLRAFDNISGTPAPKAMTLRAVVQAAGHEVVIVESTSERATVKGRRKGDTEWQTSTWDVPRARMLANFTSNPNYKTNLAQMLVARATAEVCRWVAADAVMGMPYAAEELDSDPGHYANARGVQLATRRLTAADLDQPAIEAAGPAEMMTDQQRRQMFALWGELGYAGEANRAARLEITAKILRLAELESSTELTADEADRVIAALIERRDTAKAGQ